MERCIEIENGNGHVLGEITEKMVTMLLGVGSGSGHLVSGNSWEYAYQRTCQEPGRQPPDTAQDE